MIYNFSFNTEFKKRKNYEIIARKILGVEESSPYWIIKKNYIKLAKQYHPDLNKNPLSEDKFKDINTAYKILTENNYGTDNIIFLTISEEEIEQITKINKVKQKYNFDEKSGYYAWWQDNFT